MAQEPKEKMSKSSLVKRVGGIVAVLALLSTGLSHVEDIVDGGKSLIDKYLPKHKCYNVNLNYKKEVPYSRINDLDIFEIQADNECSGPIMVRVEFISPQNLKINKDGDPKLWPHYTILSGEKGFRMGIILPDPFILTAEREFQVQIQWTIYQRGELGGEKVIDINTRTIKIIDG